MSETAPPAAPDAAAAAKAAEKAAFEALCDELREEVVAELGPTYGLPEDAVQWIDRMIDYTCKGGKMNRGLSVLHCTRALAGDACTPELERQASILGWCIEWLQAWLLVADDVMDSSTTRRGQPCWFRNSDVGLRAINDAFLVQSMVLRLIKSHFAGHAAYVPLMELFLEVQYQTELGQLLDLTSANADGSFDFDRYTMERYKLIVKYKTSFYTFYLSAACAMHLCGHTEPEKLNNAREVCLAIGEYFQIQDDYLDACLAAVGQGPEALAEAEVLLGKRGTDVQEAKLGWLCCQALMRCSPEQRALLAENYGKEDMACVERVKQLYLDLDLPAVYAEYEEQVYAEITAMIQTVAWAPPEMFTNLVNKIYGRTK